MVEFIKAYNEGEDTVFELSVTAVTTNGAKSRAIMSLLGRRPGEVTAVQKVEVMPLGTGYLKDHRVLVYLDSRGDIRSRLKIPEARQRLEELL